MSGLYLTDEATLQQAGVLAHYISINTVAYL